MPFIKDQPIPRLELDQCAAAVAPQFDDDALRRLARNAANFQPAALRETGVDEFLMVHPVEETMREAAGKTLGEFPLAIVRENERLMRPGGIDGGAVGLRGGGNVVGALEPP